MKHQSQSMAAWIMVLMAAVFFAKPVWANMDAGEMAEYVQNLRQASAELKAADPKLSDKLADYADKKEKMAKKADGEWQQKAEDAVKLRQAANQLKATDKDLSDSLNDIADRCEKKMKK